MPITPTVTQVGFSTASGTLAQIVDGNAGTGWAPIADRLLTYTAQFVTDTPGYSDSKGGFPGVLIGTPNVGASFAFLQFDYGTAVKLAAFLLQVEGDLTLGAACLIGSDFDATLPNQAIQSGDVCLGLYTAVEITSNLVLITRAAQQDIKKRYFRLLQRTSE